MKKPIQTNNTTEQKAELLSFVSYRISQAHAKLNSQAAHILRSKSGLSLVQWRIIASIESFGPVTTSSELIERMELDKGLFSRNLKTLVEDGLVKSELDDKDQRRSLLSLSTRGQAVFDQTIPAMRKRQAHLMHNMSGTEKEILFKALGKLEENAQQRTFD